MGTIRNPDWGGYDDWLERDYQAQYRYDRAQEVEEAGWEEFTQWAHDTQLDPADPYAQDQWRSRGGHIPPDKDAGPYEPAPPTPAHEGAQ